MNRLLTVLLGLIIGCAVGYIGIVYTPLFNASPSSFIQDVLPAKKQVIGFLPYWLAGQAHVDYSRYITTLTYFSLTVEPDGSIRKLINEQEEDPGWHALRSGSMDKFFNDAQKK